MPSVPVANESGLGQHTETGEFRRRGPEKRGGIRYAGQQRGNFLTPRRQLGKGEGKGESRDACLTLSQ